MGRILHQNQGKVRFFSFGGWTKGVFIKQEAVTAQIKALLARTGIKLAAFTKEFTLFDSPLLDTPPEVV
jgi:hypothetical protein